MWLVASLVVVIVVVVAVVAVVVLLEDTHVFFFCARIMVKAYHYQQYIRDRLFWDAEIDGMIEIHFSDRTTEDMIAKMI